MREQCYIRKSFGPLSSGTRVELLHRQNGQSIVRLLNKPSEKMSKINHPLIVEMGRTGIFRIPTDLLVERRQRGRGN